MPGKKCKHCGSSEIEVDPARGDAVCTSCGTVLEDNIIVAEVEFQENAHGVSSAIGQFVSAESKGGATGFGGAFNAGIGQESREITLKKAREGITALCQQLRLNQQCIDIACNFFKMALSRHLTIGRPSGHTQAACVYITCRTEGTAHLLIDISDALNICCYQLGRTYYKLSRSLCINIPPTDPCLYILRFASQLQFEDKQHEVSMTALRLVQRMKRDSIHSGRRPSGICGAALLLAARYHNFNRTPADVVRIVRIHESTLRKRLFEFGDTPSSSLTVDEFLTVDLEEEQDPPAFRAARKRDKEFLQKLMEEDGERELTELQKEIEHQLEKDQSKKRKSDKRNASIIIMDDELDEEDAEANRFAAEDNLSIIGEIVNEVDSKNDRVKQVKSEKFVKGLGPDLAVIGLRPQDKSTDTFLKPEPKVPYSKDLTEANDLLLSEKDEEYVNTYIMNDEEARHKTEQWKRINENYLKNQKIKAEVRERELKEGKDKKRKVRGSYRKKVPCNAATPGEAIEKMLAEKRISMKINYDILKSLDQGQETPTTPARTVTDVASTAKEMDVPQAQKSQTSTAIPGSPAPRKRKKAVEHTPQTPPTFRTPHTPLAPRTPQASNVSRTPHTSHTPATSSRSKATPTATDIAEDYEEDSEMEQPEANGEMSLAEMLQNGQDDDFYDYDEY